MKKHSNKIINIVWGKNIAIYIFLLLLANPVSAFVFVEKSQPACYVVLRPDAPRAELFAADEFVMYVEKMTGVTIPVRQLSYAELPPVGNAVLIGQGLWLDQPRFGDAGDDLGVLGPESYLIRTSMNDDPPCILVAGGSPRGTVYAVYELLHLLGVRWFASDITRVPRFRTVEIGETDRVDFPSFSIRSIDIDNGDMTPEWAAHLRLTVPDGYLEHSLGCNPVFNPLRVSLADLFARVDVKASADEDPCYFSSAIVTAAVADSLAAFGDRNPGITETILEIGNNEIEYRFDSCARSLKLTPGPEDFLLLWADKLNNTMRKSGHMRLFLSFPQEFSRPPLKVKLPDEIGIIIPAPENDYRLPYTESVDDTILSFIGDLRKWSEHAGMLYLSIPLGHSEYPSSPFPENRQTAENILLFRDTYVSGLDYRFTGGPGCYIADAEMLIWVLSRLMWESDVEPEKLEREWIKGVFGNAWGPMADYHNHVAQRGQESQIPISRSTDPLSIYDSTWITDAERILQRAFAQSMTDSIAHRQVMKTRLGVQYLRLLDIRRELIDNNRWSAGYDRQSAIRLLHGWRESMAVFGYNNVSPGVATSDFAGDMVAVLEKNR